MNRSIVPTPSNKRVFGACLLSLMTLLAPIAAVGAATRRALVPLTVINTKATESAEPSLVEPAAAMPAPAPVPAPMLAVGPITATKTDSFPDPDGDGKADLGSTISYTIGISNTGSDAATGVTFDDVYDANTTLVAGSLNVSPLAIDESYTAVGNTLLEVGNATAQTGPQKTVAGGVLSNGDTDYLGDTFTISTFDATSANGGTVTMVTTGPDAGAFTYISAANYTGPDSFTYTLRDDGTDGIAGNADDLTGVGTVTITVANQVWYVDNAAAAGGDGRSTTPFDALSDVSGVAGPDTAGDIIYINTGIAAYTGGIVLLGTQTLHGEGTALVVGPDTLAAAGGDPTITNAAGDGVTLASGNTLTGFTVGNTTVYDITNTTATTVGTLNITNVVLNGSGNLFKADSGGALTVAFESAAATSAVTTGILISGGATGNFSVAGTTTIDDATLDGISISNSALSATFTGAVTILNDGGANGDGVDLLTNSGMYSFNGGLSITVNGTGAFGFRAQSSGTVNIVDVGTTQITSNGGTALLINPTTLNATLDTITSGGGADGISLNGMSGSLTVGSVSINGQTVDGIDITNSAGSVTINGGTIGNTNDPAGAGVDISGGAGNVTITATINKTTAGDVVEISGRTGGTVDFNGNLTSTAAAGVDLTSNTSGTIRFDGGMTLSTGATSAFSSTASSGSTLIVTDPGGPGSGNNNTLTTTTGIALNIVSTTIGAEDLNFQSISANGASSGIVLNATGSSGGLTVTGNGGSCTSAGTCTGGAIQNTTGSGINATGGTQDLQITRMFITNPGIHGVDAPNLRGTGFFNNGVISEWVNATGIGISIVNNNTNLTSFSVNGTTFNGTNTGNDGIFFEAQGTSNMTLSVDGSTFTDIFGDGVEIQGIGSSTGTLNVTVKNSSFNNAAVLGNGGIQMDTIGNVTLTAMIDNNNLDDLMRPVTNLGAIGGTNGGTADTNITIKNNTINDIDGARGITYAADGSGLSTLLIDNNNIDRLGSTTKYAIQVNMIGTAVISSPADVTVTNNDIGQQAALWTSGNGTAEAVFFLTQNSSTMDVLVSNNIVTANATLEVIRGRAIGTSSMNLTYTSNTVTDSVGSHVGELAGRTDLGTPTMCMNVSGNTVPAAGVGVILISEGAGTINVTQANAAAVAAANNGATVTVTGSPTFGAAACSTPLLLADGGVEAATDYSSLLSALSFSRLSSWNPNDVSGWSVPLSSAVTTSLTQQQLDSIVAAAIERWSGTGLTPQQIASLHQLKFELADLKGIHLGEAEGNRILIDRSAGGKGWFVDPSPLYDASFGRPVSASRLYTDPFGGPAGRVDLLTTIAHEIGHKLGIDDSYAEKDRDSVMYGYLSVGERRLPARGQAATAKPGTLKGAHFLSLSRGAKLRPVETNNNATVTRSTGPLAPMPPLTTVNIGTLPGNKSLTIVFQVTVNTTGLGTATSVSNQGTVSGTNFASVLTDDQPGTAAPNEPTVTPISRLDLEVTKTDGVTSTTPGSSLHYLITYTNLDHAANGVVLTETVPTGTTKATDASGWSCPDGSVAGTTCTINLGNLPRNGVAGYTGTKTFSVTVNNPAAAGLNDIVNTASIAHDGTYEPDMNPANNTTTDTDTLNAAPDLNISKTDGVLATTPGSTLTYTINYSNVGTQNAAGVVLTETVPVGTTFVAAGSSAWTGCANGDPAGTVCTINVGTLNAGAPAASATFVVLVTNPAAAGLDDIVNTASIADDGLNGTDPTLPNTATDTDTLNATPDMTISKVADVPDVAPGDTIVYTITYTNVGNQNATGVVITETVPTNTTFSTADSAPTVWSCADNSPAGTICTVNIGPVAGGGGTGNLTFGVEVDDPVAPGATQISNTASVADDGANGADPTPLNNTTTVNTPIIVCTPPPANLANWWTGDDTARDIAGGNDGTLNGDDGPADLEYSAGKVLNGFDFDGINDLVNVGDVDLPSTFTIDAWVNPTNLSVERAIVSKDDGAAQRSYFFHITSGGALRASVNSAGGFTVYQTADSIITPGSFQHVAVTYDGAAAAGQKMLFYKNGALVLSTVQSSQDAGGAPVNNSLAALIGRSATTNNTFLGVIDEVEFFSRVLAASELLAIVTADSGGKCRNADLGVTKTDSPDPVDAGTNLTYTITLVNNGPVDAETVTVTDAVPANTTFVSAAVTTGTGWTPSTPAPGGTGNVEFSKSVVSNGETAVFEIVVNVNGNTAHNTVLSNTVTAATTTNDPNTTNDNDTETTDVRNDADLSVTKTDSPDPVNAGSHLTYTINFLNSGTGSANTVKVSDAVPTNTTFVSATVTAGTGWTPSLPPVGGTGTVEFTKGLVANGETATFEMVVKVNANLPSPGPISNTVNVTTTTTDPDGTDNIDTETTDVNTSADLQVTKTDSPDPVVAGHDVTYTITLTNAGPSDAQTVELKDNTPTNTTFVSSMQTAGPAFTCTDPPVGGTGEYKCTIATMAAGASATFELVVNVNANATGSISNTATATTATSDPDTDNNSATEGTTISGGLGVVGSTGIVDEASLNIYEVRNQFATIKDSLVSGTVTYRYNLVGVDDILSCDGCTYNIRVRYRDTGDAQNVQVHLRAASTTVDGVSTIYTFNSDAPDTFGTAAPANINGNQTVDRCVTFNSPHMSAGDFVYFLEVVVDKTANDGTSSPGFIAFVISTSDCED